MGNTPVTNVYIAGQEELKNQPERVMVLTGTWEMPDCRYDLKILLHIKSDGKADGAIDWNAKYVYGIRKNYSDEENVTGSITTQYIDLKGFETGPRLYPDHYRVDLFGDNRSGIFRGISETCNKDWSGTMHGSYVYLNQ